MFNLWQRPRERFSIDELKYLNDVLQRHAVITDANKDAIVETLRSIAELMIWGDQHEPAFFEFFVEHGLFAHIVHILSMSNKSSSCGVTVQLLQTLNIMLQNIKSEKAIAHLFSKEHINNVITFPFDFSDEELLAYYISFLKVISMKLDKSTISYFLVNKTDGSLSFPLYVEAIRFFHHEESMVRIAVRTISLTVYHVDDERVRRFVLSASAIRYFEDLAIFIRQQSFTLARLVANAAKNFASVVDVGRVEASIAEIGDLLYYCNDVMNAGIPELSEVVSEHLASIWLFPVLLTSLSQDDEFESPHQAKRISPLCSMYLMSRVFHVITYCPFVEGAIRALVARVSSPREDFEQPMSTLDLSDGQHSVLASDPDPNHVNSSEGGESSLGGLWRGLFGDSTGKVNAGPEEPAVKMNGDSAHDTQILKGARSSSDSQHAVAGLRSTSSDTSSSQGGSAASIKEGSSVSSLPGHRSLDPSASAWDTVVSYLLSDKERWILAALCILCGLLHNASVEDELLDELGVLPNHKRQRRMLVEALVGDTSSEEDLKRILQQPNASDSSSSSLSVGSALDGIPPTSNTRGEPVGTCSVCGGTPLTQSSSPWHEGFQNLVGQKQCTCTSGAQQQAPQHIYFSPSCRHPKRRRQVIDTLFLLFCRRPPPCPEALWHAAWLLRQLLPAHARLSSAHTQLLNHAYECARADVIVEMLDCWSDLLPQVLEYEWKVCSKALESATLANDSALVLLPSLSPLLAEGDTSSAAYGERMRSVVKVFVVILRMRCVLLGLPLPGSLNFADAGAAAPDARLWRKGLVIKQPQEGEEVSFAVGDALPCRVAFERGKEKKVLLLVASHGADGWILLAESVNNKTGASTQRSASGRRVDPKLPPPGAATAILTPTGSKGEDPTLVTATIRVVAPLAGSQPTCDPKHKRWLHLRIRSPQQPPADSGTLGSRSPMGSRAQSKRLADGRWTLAFMDEQQCRRAQLAVMEEIYVQGNAVRNMLEPVLGALPPFRLHRDRQT